MKRTPLKRRTPLRAKPRRHAPAIEREPKPMARPAVKSLHRGTYSGSTSGQVVEKAQPLQHEGYMRLVRALPCAHCGLPGQSQFCHSDEGKGTGIKSDCRLGWPGCPDCHRKVGTDRIYPKAERRELEAYMAAKTRAAIEAAGTWPKSLPKWEGA